MAEEALKKTEEGQLEAEKTPHQRKQRGRVSKEKEAGFVSCCPEIRRSKRKNYSFEPEGSSEDVYLKLTYILSS